MNETERTNLIEESDKLDDDFITKFISSRIKTYDPLNTINSLDLKVMINLIRKVNDLKDKLDEITKSENYEDRELLVAVKTIIKNIRNMGA